MKAKSSPIEEVASPAPTKREIGSSKFQLVETVGQRIKWARERKDMTQKELGRLIGKSRASVVQYENSNITAPIDVITDLATALFVAPEYLAFGRSGVPGVKNAEEEIQTFSELRESGTTLVPTGGWAIPRDMFGDYDTKLMVVHLHADEPHFEFKKSDRVMVCETENFRRDGCYLIAGQYGHRVVRLSSSMAAGNTLRMTNGFDGTDTATPVGDLKIVGLIVGSFRRFY